MHVEANGTAKIKISSSGIIVTITASELDWDCQGVDERQMGPEALHSADYEIDGKVVTWNLWEYPLGVENHQETDLPNGLELIQDINYKLIHDPE